MSFTIFGRLRGFLCDDCDEPLEGVVIRFYATDAPDVPDRAVADPKETATFVEVAGEARAARLLTEATVEADGSYRAMFPESYAGRAVDVDLYCGNVPRFKPPKKAPEPVQLHLTTLQPRWRETEEGPVAAFEYAVPARIWCGIRARLGAWVVCGTVTDCKSGAPVAGVVVKAFDADWIQDDALGSGTTDAAGHYRIDYNAEDFRRTPFSPGFNLELVAGPDLYFHIEGPTGSPVLLESPAEGRTPARENSGPCKCVDLCITGRVGGGGVIPTVPMFTKVGIYRVDPADGDFTAAGTTTVGDLAFTGDIPLIGIMPGPLSPDAIEYQFRVNGAPVSAAQMSPTVIGELQYFAWSPVLSAWVMRSTDFWANRPGATVSIRQNAGPDRVVVVNTPVASDGWIKAPRTDDLVPGGEGRFIPNGNLALLRTTAYTDESFDLSAATPTPLDAGDSVPAAQRSTMPTFSIAFAARKSDGTTVGSGSLATIAFSNLREKYTRHPYWAGGDVTTAGVASLGIAEMATSGGCAELGDIIHVLYTAYHPYIGQPTIQFIGNPMLPGPISPPVPGGQAVSAMGGDVVDIALLAKCAYIVRLSVPLRLTSGGPSLNWVVIDEIAFCKE